MFAQKQYILDRPGLARRDQAFLQRPSVGVTD
jgi:hypothetical protein